MATQPDFEPDEPEPMAPPTEVWQRLTPAERARVLERLGPTPSEALPPIGDPHIDAERAAEDAIGGWFRRCGRKAYIGRGITVYYPAEPRFDPDFFVVLDAPDGQRMSWVVDHEGQGLDFVLAIHHEGDLRKDDTTNVQRYARLGIPEYFLYDVGRGRIQGWRMGGRPATYAPIVPQRGRWRSEVLGADLAVADARLRFYLDGALLPLAAEIEAELVKALDTALARGAEEAARAKALEAENARLRALEEENARLRALEEENARLRAVEAENAELRAELARLRGEAPRT